MNASCGDTLVLLRQATTTRICVLARADNGFCHFSSAGKIRPENGELCPRKGAHYFESEQFKVVSADVVPPCAHLNFKEPFSFNQTISESFEGHHLLAQ